MLELSTQFYIAVLPYMDTSSCLFWIQKRLSNLHMPAFYEKLEVNFTLVTKIPTTETVGYRPAEMENFSLPQSAIQAYCYNVRQSIVTKRTALFRRHRKFDRGRSNFPFIRVRLALDLVAVHFCSSSSVHSHFQLDKTACTNLCTGDRTSK